MHTECAHRRSSHGEDGVDADRSHERGFAGHVGTADEENPGFAADADIVGNAPGNGNERVAELFGLEAWQPIEKFGEGIEGVLEAVSGKEGEKRLDFAERLQPRTNGGSGGGAPGFGCISHLDRIEEGDVEKAEEDVVERAHVFDDDAQARDGPGDREEMREERVAFEGLQASGRELFALQPGEERGEELQVFQSLLRAV